MNIEITEYTDGDFSAAAELFYETVHCVNAADYTEEQLFAWATRHSLDQRRGDLAAQNTFIAKVKGILVGFCSITDGGELDFLFVHKDFQRMGIASALCDKAECGFKEIYAYVSITARRFFEKRGYTVTKKLLAERRGVKLNNFEMRKKV